VWGFGCHSSSTPICVQAPIWAQIIAGKGPESTKEPLFRLHFTSSIPLGANTLVDFGPCPAERFLYISDRGDTLHIGRFLGLFVIHLPAVVVPVGREFLQPRDVAVRAIYCRMGVLL
jgi:hypothetical protein